MKENPNATDAPGAPPADGPPAVVPRIVGIGASAGGMRALQAFLDGLPERTGLAFVVVMHLSPEHESTLAERLQSHTSMPCVQVHGRTLIEPDHVYVIPPALALSVVDGHLDVAPFSEPLGRRASIDLFLRTLADIHPDGVAVLLSGTGADGTLGLRRLKERGGLVFVQDPADAEFDGMPRSALATGLVDVVLPAAELGGRLAKLVSSGPPALGGSGYVLTPEDDDALVRVMSALRVRTGHDFADYKQTTVLRRIARRLQVHGLGSLTAYADHLGEQPVEARALLKDLLISVTNFFRDADAFAALERDVIPGLFKGKGLGDTVRVWSVGAATGEEAYSLAIVLAEHAARLDAPPAFQVFATDVSDESLAFAREALYPDTIVADVSEARLERFFVREGGFYRVRAALRERVLFASHNVLKDPPFSRLDLIACRNLLIYIDRGLQQRVFEAFHYALRPGGALFLGSAESPEGSTNLFTSIRKKQRLFARREVPAGGARVPTFPLALPLPPNAGVPRPPDARAARAPRSAGDPPPPPNLFDAFSPPSVIVDAQHGIVYLSEGAGRYLLHAGGTPTKNLVKLVREELRVDLLTGLQEAFSAGRPWGSRSIAVRIDGEPCHVHVLVRPGNEEAGTGGLALVVFSDVEAAGEAPAGDGAAAGPSERVLEEEAARMRLRLRTTIEEYETSNEELKAANEELQSVNEEFKSALEELETSKEELQSVNEELHTVNQELKTNVEDLARANGDLQNLMAATDIGTLFLDRSLCVKRFTPAVLDLFNVIPADQGRPLAHVTHRLRYPELQADAAAVLATLVPIAREVESEAGRWYLARVRPYRTADDHIDGVVLTFVDLTERKLAEEELRESDRRYRTLVGSMDHAFALCEMVVDGRGQPTDYRILEANAAFSTMTGVGMDPVGRTARELVPTLEDAWVERYARVGLGRETLRFQGEVSALGRWLDVYAAPTEPEGAGRFTLLFQDVTAQRVTQDALRVSEARYRTLFTSMDEGYCVIEVLFDADGQPVDYRFVEVNSAFEKQSGLRDAVGQTARALMPDLEARWFEAYGRVVRTGEPMRIEDEVPALDRWIDLYAFRIGAPEQARVAVLFNDVTARKRAEVAAEAAAARDAFRVVLADALRPLSDAAEIQGEASRILAERLGVGRAYYVEVDEAAGVLRVERDFVRGGEPSLAGEHRLADFERAVGVFRPGVVSVVDDTQASDLTPPDERAASAALGIAAYIAAPLFKDGGLVGAFCVTDARPRPWSEGEADLVREVGEVVWAAIERARAEAALRVSEERLRLATDVSKMGLWDWDLVADVIVWSPHAHVLLGTTPEALGGRMATALDRIHPDDRADVDRAIETALRGEAPYRAEFRIADGEGGQRWIAGAGEVYRDAAGAPTRMVGVLHDVTARRAADEGMQALNDLLEGRVAEQTVEVRTLVSSLTLAEQQERHRLAHVLHDHLQQLLFGIQMQMQLMRTAPEGERVRIAGHVNNMGRMLDEAILATRTLTSELAPPVLKGPTLKPIVHYLALQVEETHGLTVDLDVDDGLRVYGESLRVLVFQLVRELLFNVVKHAHTRAAKITAHESAERIVIEVRDHGRGFDVEAAVERRSAVGGFGLFNVQDRLRALGGRMTIVSTPEAGTTVTVEVPNHPEDEG